MIRGIYLSTIGLVMLAVPAFAAENTCKAPMAPAVPDGKTAVAHDLVVAAGEVKTFIAASDAYQQCLNDWVAAETTAASEAKKPLDSKVKAEHDRLGDLNQKEKERVGGLYNASATAYKAAHK